MDFLLQLFIQSAHADPTTANASAPSVIAQLALPILFFVIFYFLIIRPQSKRNKEHREMIDTLKEDTEVIFAGGLMGRIKKLEGDYAVVALNKTTEVKIQRASVISVLPAGTIDGI